MEAGLGWNKHEIVRCWNEKWINIPKKKKKVFSFRLPRSFSLSYIHSFLPFLLEKWNPKRYFFLFLFNGMESKFTFGVIIFIASDRSEFQKWKIEIERSKKDVRNFGYKSFFSISPSHFFYLWGLFLSLLRRQGKKFRVFLDVTTCIRCHSKWQKCIDDVEFLQKSIPIVFRHNTSFKIENGQAYKKFLVRD